MSPLTPSPHDAILVVYPFCLDHVGHGNIQRILAVARYFATTGTAVDLVYQGSPRVPKVEAQYAGFRRVFAVDGAATSSEEDACARRVAAFYSGHELPRVHMRPSAALTTLVRSLIDAEPYRAVIATYAFTAPIFAGLRRRVLRVCDVQDVMHEHAAACEGATGRASSFDMPAATETFLWRQWDVLVAITPEDCARIRRDALPRQHVISARHSVATLAPTASPGLDDVAFYAGSDNQSNVQSVTWLLERVWPLVRRARPAARLRVAGLICSALPEHLRRAPGVEVLGFQRDVSQEIATCGVLVAPYLYGSGLKIKVVEAACAGKAIVTTSAGLAGSGLDPGRALAVHDDPEAFAGTVADLLGDRARRGVLAETGRIQAAALFSPEACYAPIRTAITLLDVPPLADGVSGAPPVALDRLALVVDHVRPARLILWGNGSHTRMLLRALATRDVAAHLIVDGRGRVPGTSPEGLPVVPASDVEHQPGDLIVLSSETFEPEMWRDLAVVRDAGGQVLGLSNSSYISRGLLDALSSGVRAQIGASPDASRSAGACVLWDAGAGRERWWRVCLVHDLADAAQRTGILPIVVWPASLASDIPVLGDMPAAARVLPILELSGWSVEAQDVEGGAPGLTRASDLMTKTTREALARLACRRDDVLVVIEPSLSECLGLARALETVGVTDRPKVVVWTSGLQVETLQLDDDERRAYWRLAISALDDAADGRFAVVGPDAAISAPSAAFLRRTVHATGYPAILNAPGPHARRPHVVCLGHVGVPRVRPMLEALVNAFGESYPPSEGPTIAWRSDQHDGRPGARPQWAIDLASTLGITLLDDAVPSAVRDALADADVVAVLSDSGQEWITAARAHARASGASVVTPAGSDDLVAQVELALDRHRVRQTSGDGHLLRMDTPAAAGADGALARLLNAVAGHRAVVTAMPTPATQASPQPASPETSSPWSPVNDVAV